MPLPSLGNERHTITRKACLDSVEELGSVAELLVSGVKVKRQDDQNHKRECFLDGQPLPPSFQTQLLLS